MSADHITMRLGNLKSTTQGSFRRPTIKIEVDKSPFHDGCDVCIQIDAEYGQPMRWIELRVDEARTLAAYLVNIADTADADKKALELDDAVPF